MRPANVDELLRVLNIDSRSIDKLLVYEQMLRRWARVLNLVSPRTLDEVWLRHFIDSAQVQRCVPDARIWCDLGSGAGFPGLVTAILLADVRGAHVHLVESDQRKCAFLRDVSRETGLKTTIHARRIIDVVPDLGPVDAVSARALAPLPDLIEWTEQLLIKGAVGVFPKGKDVQSELTRLTNASRFDISLSGSLSHPSGSLVIARMHVDRPEPFRDSTKHEGSGSR